MTSKYKTTAKRDLDRASVEIISIYKRFPANCLAMVAY